MNRTYEISSEYLCDRCGEYAQSFVQTVEGDWICAICEGDCSCSNCGTITLDVKRYQGELLCPDCIDCIKSDNPFSVQSFAHEYFGYTK